MKKLGLIVCFLIGSIVSASATCTGPAVMHDFPGTSFNMSLATNAGDGNCASNVTVVGTVPLPTGAATAAKQPAIGTAGSASVDVLTIQGIASMTKLLVTPDSVALPANQSVNVSQINAVTPLMGNGVTGPGSQRVTIASDNTAFSVNATLSAETTKVIGTVRTASGGIASGSVASGAIASGAYASGSIGSGAVASGAVSAGALAAGAGVDGWDLTQGAIADAAVAAGATGSISAKLRAISRDTPTITTWAGGTLGAMANYGTSPGGVLVPGVNAFVTNTNANGQATAANSSPVVNPVATNAGAAVVKGGVAVVNGGSTYQAVAASQTATVLQTSTGAAGDYLSHCVIYPTSTSPGVVTVFDNTNTAATSAILFAGGATSTSNLTPISVPVGAVSSAGAWKVTTGANVSVVCYGKFS